MISKSTGHPSSLKMQTTAAAWGIITLVATGFIVAFCMRNYQGIEEIIRSAGIIGPLVSVGLYSVLAFTPIPSDSLTVINGLIFGPIGGILISWMGNNAAAVTEYVVGKSLGKVSNFNVTKQKLPWGLESLPVNSVWFLLLGRFLPGYGGKVVSLLGGMYNVPLWRYIWTALLTNLIGSILFALVGHGLWKLL